MGKGVEDKHQMARQQERMDILLMAQQLVILVEGKLQVQLQEVKKDMEQQLVISVWDILLEQVRKDMGEQLVLVKLV